MKVLVVGAGEMGRWFADVLVDGHADEHSLAFADADPDTAASAAADLATARTVPLDIDERFDIVCVAVPIPAAAEEIATHADRATAAVVDVTGVATAPVEAMREHAPDLERLSLHPLFAPENAPGNVAMVPDEPGPVTDEIRAALVACGNDAFETTPAEHDEAMETVQAQAHVAVLAFGLAAADVPEGFQTPVSGALFDLVEQVTDGDPRVYSDIQAAFDGAGDLAAAARELAEADADGFEERYRQVREKR
jgi:prephenate dehydrogenase